MTQPDDPDEGVAAIVLAAGQGVRLQQDRPKAFVELAGQTLLERSLRALAQVDVFDWIQPVIPADDLDRYRAIEGLAAIKGMSSARPSGVRLAEPVSGGAERQDSVHAGLAGLPSGVGWVAVHDAARCLVSPEDVRRVVAEARASGAAILAERARDTLKRVEAGRVMETPERAGLWAAQTPQVIRRDWLLAGLEAAERDGRRATDDAQLVEWLGHEVRVVESQAANPKLTLPDDLVAAEALLGRRSRGDGDAMRIGQGYDIHRLVPGRALVLAGIEIPFERGLEGHSDGDAPLHAVADAILGAIGEGDLGRHFPSSDERWRGADSGRILREVVAKMGRAGWQLANVDATIVAQVPRLAAHQPVMHARLADLLGTSLDRVNLKVTSTDRLGAIGREEGIAAQAVVLLEPAGSARSGGRGARGARGTSGG